MTLNLHGRWSLQSENGDTKAALSLPGDIVGGLHGAGLIPDPYWGQNEYDLRWIGEQDWVLSRSFDVDRTDLVLILSEVDTVAEVSVNGTAVLSCQNVHRSYRVDLSDVLRIGSNDISIVLKSPVVAGAAAQARMPFYIPVQEGNSPIPNGNMLRKAQCDFGWDWNIALANSGVTGDIRLEPVARHRVTAVIVNQTHGDGYVDVAVRATCTGGPADWSVSLCGVTQSGKSAGIDTVLRIKDPELWWPVGLGDQTLHDLAISFADATDTRRIGLRDMQLVSEPDDIGRSFLFRVNGHDTFAKGANWIPADALTGRINRDDVRGLLQSAVDAHMNMIRIWGGGRYEPDWFYDLCDEMGLMVWQDFMFACNLYPSTPDFLAEVAAEVRENVARIQHHACIALWCGDNELIGALTWFEESRNDRDRYLVSYDRLNRTIENALLETDPAANWWPSSPSPGPLSFGDAWHDDTSGDMHFWSVWHEGRDFDHYRDVSPRFCSEFGFQSYPSMNIIRQFADPADFNIAAPVMESHQKNAGGNARIAETMFRYFRFPVDFENFVYVSQVQQALAIKTAVTHWRSLRPHCMGTLIWQLNDTWPVCSWSSLDHGGGWKVLHHLAREFYRPVTVVAVPDGDNLTLRGINDTRNPVDITVTAYATDMTGTARELGTATAEIGSNAGDLLQFAAYMVAPHEMLTFVWSASDGSGGGDVFAPLPYKSYDLLPADLSLTTAPEGGTWVLDITAQAMAFFVTAEASIPGRFDRNALHLGPGHTATLRFTPDDPTQTPSFTLRDLHSATYTT